MTERTADETNEARAWLIEWPANDNMPARWWHPADGWMLDANRAARFSRKQDAEAYIKQGRFGVGAIATEHKWLSMSPAETPAALPDSKCAAKREIDEFREHSCAGRTGHDGEHKCGCGSSWPSESEPEQR